ncbi:MAG: V-type ATP synthase subunit E [Gammaproteobacteria bacterium]|nr:V-type ATP synthase subunit E [Gammaproteobacteria bacterium]
MSHETQLVSLQTALLARARALADETTTRGKREAERIIQDTHARLRAREESEHVSAKLRAERVYRQKVQAAEIKMRAELDQLRWVHVQQVMDALQARLTALVEDQQRYLPLLKALIAGAAQAIEDQDLVAEVNARDYTHLQSQWSAIAAEVAPGKRIALSPAGKESSGGVLVRNADNTIRVDNFFEGRLERLADAMQRVIVERLFAMATPMGSMLSG